MKRSFGMVRSLAMTNLASLCRDDDNSSSSTGDIDYPINSYLEEGLPYASNAKRRMVTANFINSKQSYTDTQDLEIETAISRMARCSCCSNGPSSQDSTFTSKISSENDDVYFFQVASPLQYVADDFFEFEELSPMANNDKSYYNEFERESFYEKSGQEFENDLDLALTASKSIELLEKLKFDDGCTFKANNKTEFFLNVEGCYCSDTEVESECSSTVNDFTICYGTHFHFPSSVEESITLDSNASYQGLTNSMKMSTLCQLLSSH